MKKTITKKTEEVVVVCDICGEETLSYHQGPIVSDGDKDFHGTCLVEFYKGNQA